jgi:hypothetical protein
LELAAVCYSPIEPPKAPQKPPRLRSKQIATHHGKCSSLLLAIMKSRVAATCREPAIMTGKEEIKRSDERNSQERLTQGGREGGKDTSKFQRCVQSGYWAARRTKDNG